MVIYRTNTSALEDFSILVQQERPVFPGLLWVKTLYHSVPGQEVNVEVIDARHLRCTLPHEGRDARTKTLILTVD